MREPALYFWVDNQIVRMTEEEWINSDTDLMHNYHCVDAAYVGVGSRYGMFRTEWKTIPKDEFPKEFLLNLLLIGVT